jgi:gluconate 2-dehydrogenase gamma chain
MSEQPDRRTFLKSLGTVGATGVAAIVSGDAVSGDAVAGPQAAPSPAAAPAPPTAAPLTYAPSTYTFLSPPEAAFVEAAVDRMIPADDLTPGGTDCGVATFIDRQLAGAWGSGDRLYMQGPWQRGTPSQGYQLPMTPAECFRAAIAATNAHCRKTYQKDFDRLPREQQVPLLQQLERGEVALDPLSSQQFFSLLLDLAMQGFFADPVYGGNRDKVAWKMIGFPGAIAIHSEHIKTYRNKKYDAEPTSIVDLS